MIAYVSVFRYHICMKTESHIALPSAQELADRLTRLRDRLDRQADSWRLAVVTGRVSLYYLTGTMCTGALWIPRDGDATLFVHRGYGRAVNESPLERIERINSYRDMAAAVTVPAGPVFLETDTLTVDNLALLRRYFSFDDVQPLGGHLLNVRAVKSDYELDCICRSGKIHAEVLDTLVPELLGEGLTEAQLGTAILNACMTRGAQGIVRVHMADWQLFAGYIGFSENNLMPTCFNGPDGTQGLHPAVPMVGSAGRSLRKGDLVFADTGSGVDGYHTDKTAVYSFGAAPCAAAVEAHARCVAVQAAVAERLVPGAIPSQIYDEVLAALDDDFLEGFMGPAGQAVRFLGHGVGLEIDEFPVIAARFDEPLQANMVIAIEPKKALPGIGMVGTENTFVVTEGGGQCLTGDHFDIITC